MPVAQDIADRIVTNQRLFILLGAGASAGQPARIPVDMQGPNGIGWLLAITDTGDADLAREKFGQNPRLADLLQAIDKARFRELLLRQNWQALEPNQAHEVLARLYLEGFRIELATVNYDPLLEKALRKLGAGVQIVCSRDALEPFREGKYSVFKIHGCPYTESNPENLLVTEQDLQQGRPWTRRMLLSRFQESHCVYVGFSGNAEYVLSDIRVIAQESQRQILSSFAVDIRGAEEVFAGTPSTPLARFVQTLGIARERYCGDGADSVLEEVADVVARSILNRQMTLAIDDATQICNRRAEVEGIANRIRETVLAHLNHIYAYDFVARLEAGLDGHRTLQGAEESLRGTFKWILTLIVSGILARDSVAPVFSYPFKRRTGPPIVVFAGDGFIHVDAYANRVEERLNQDSNFRRSIGCESDATVVAIVLRCAGNPTRDRGELLANRVENLLGATRGFFIWRTDNALHASFENNNVLTSLV